MQRALLSLALIATASVSYAQTVPAGEPTDSFGRPYVGRNDWVRQPGDQPGPASGMGGAMNAGIAPNMASAPAMQSEMAPPMASQTGPHRAEFRDEYGFRYDAQGNRLDARGNIISPHTR